MSNYRFSEEYLDRFGLNKGDFYWIEEAVKFYKEKAKAEIEESISEGGRAIMTPGFVDHLYNDILTKLEMWIKPEKVFEEEDELPF